VSLLSLLLSPTFRSSLSYEPYDIHLCRLGRFLVAAMSLAHRWRMSTSRPRRLSPSPRGQRRLKSRLEQPADRSHLEIIMRPAAAEHQSVHQTAPPKVMSRLPIGHPDGNADRVLLIWDRRKIGVLLKPVWERVCGRAEQQLAGAQFSIVSTANVVSMPSSTWAANIVLTNVLVLTSADRTREQHIHCPLSCKGTYAHHPPGCCADPQQLLSCTIEPRLLSRDS
jgi:hypothetical protein